MTRWASEKVVARLRESSLLHHNCEVSQPAAHLSYCLVPLVVTREEARRGKKFWQIGFELDGFGSLGDFLRTASIRRDGQSSRELRRRGRNSGVGEAS